MITHSPSFLAFYSKMSRATWTYGWVSVTFYLLGTLIAIFSPLLWRMFLVSVLQNTKRHTETQTHTKDKVLEKKKYVQVIIIILFTNHFGSSPKYFYSSSVKNATYILWYAMKATWHTGTGRANLNLGCLLMASSGKKSDLDTPVSTGVGLYSGLVKPRQPNLNKNNIF